ncbi:phospholipid/cholesterol/gamma-HCH transport system substrate-binding protein [Pseudomonas citronellolis]|uniref:MlaD family protein n=1 Tax=Pseudomonas citronellolis TaxID=53408 RepID=UPI0020A1E9C2|nr:MlaD family protein [Pseudomonas citronellolis]MCP1646278.1 phospholipid/cholesterol/gamma-HCH transport system substrate-binding protein [Pseudomonas citronellolis]MCP1669198.1 phospholipid/cholesterol/gamma-HCH transport system substrate-binding protein [Pseudomonas citronellolis]MCP1700900.1 phospholipid/cholesterol/gamma-HCH transport system substrate-binding protein [Pseudomonas citronellolis]MCP1707096.1 phospholipid/cholesterol/gamma-HCH transport system substrate-binding protein [Pse
METRAHHVVIGLFTVLVAIGGLLFSLWLAKNSSDQQYNYYDVIFTEAVTGLSQGGTVQYSGIKVGDVVSLRLDPRDPRKVLARIRVFDQTPIRQDTRAKLAITGVTGTAIIQLSNGSPESPPLVGKDGQVPVIKTIPSPLSKLLANGEDIATNVSNLINNVNRMFSQENVDRISRTLDHIDQATATIADQRDEIRSIVRELAAASVQAKQTLANANQLLGNANQLLGSQGKDSLVSAQQTLAALQRSSEKVERLLDSNYDSVNGGLNGLGEIGPAVRELRATLENLQRVTRRLEENPTNYLFGGNRTKEFQP